MDEASIGRSLLRGAVARSMAGVSVVNGATVPQSGGGLAGANDNDSRIAGRALVNHQKVLGGAVIRGGTLRIAGSRFSGNCALNGGGLDFSGTTCLISASNFSGNTAAGDGVAIFRRSGSVTWSTTTFNTNQPNNCSRGGRRY